MIQTIEGYTPEIAEQAYVHASAVLIGRVRLGYQASIWCQAVVRGDDEWIEIGPECNVQDGAVLHADPGFPVLMDEGVSVGHLAMVHGCRIGAHSLIGIGAVIMNGVDIGQHCLIGAGALLTEGKQIPEGSLVVGSPGRVIRSLTEAERRGLMQNAQNYVKRIARYHGAGL